MEPMVVMAAKAAEKVGAELLKAHQNRHKIDLQVESKGLAGLVTRLDRYAEEMAIAIHRLATDDALHAELSAKGLQRAQTFNWEKAARKTLDVYRRVAAPRNVAASQPAASQRTAPSAENKAERAPGAP